MTVSAGAPTSQDAKSSRKQAKRAWKAAAKAEQRTNAALKKIDLIGSEVLRAEPSDLKDRLICILMEADSDQ